MTDSAATLTVDDVTPEMETTSRSEADLRQEWETPEDFMCVIRSEFKPSLDVCATRLNRKCQAFIAPPGYDDPRAMASGVDGLVDSWDVFNHCVAWCNPGFSNILPWLKKAADESQCGVESLVLTHASHGSDWWQFGMAHATECRLLKPRVQYKAPPGIKQTSNPRDGALWVFRSRWHRKTGAHVYVWNWKESVE